MCASYNMAYSNTLKLNFIIKIGNLINRRVLFSAKPCPKQMLSLLNTYGEVSVWYCRVLRFNSLRPAETLCVSRNRASSIYLVLDHYLSQCCIIIDWTIENYFSEIWIKMQHLSYKENILQISSVKWRPFCLCLNALNEVIATVTSYQTSQQSRVEQPNRCEMSLLTIKWLF